MRTEQRPCSREKSEVPAPLIPGSGMASLSLLAHIMNSKYALALPFYRQEQELRWKLLRNEILHADETALTVLWEDDRSARQKSYVWVYRISGDTERPVILYD